MAAFATQTTREVLRVLQDRRDRMDSRIIRKLIDEHNPENAEREKLYHRYEQETNGVPILTRELANPDKVNNKVANDFFGDVVDTKVGYMANEVTVQLNKDHFVDSETGEIDEEELQRQNQILQDFKTLNNSEDINSELVSMAAVTGLGVKLLYVDSASAIRSMQVDPWETIFIYDRSIFEPQAALRYYKVLVESESSGQMEERIRVEWYDTKYITYYLQQRDQDLYELDGTANPNPQPHLFDGIPLIPFPNNRQLKGDCDKSLSLIDAYDRTLSDVNSEIEQLRLAYMYVKGPGMTIKDEELQRMRQTGVIPLPPEGEVGFISKNLDDGIIEHHMDRIERNIMRFAKSVDFGDKAFGGNMPVIAFKIKIAGLEHKCLITERKFRTALRYQFSLLTSFWRQFKHIDVDPLALEFTFTRNIPLNLKEEVSMLKEGKGIVSDETLFSLMTFIDDPQKEIRLLEQQGERLAIPNLDEEEEEEPEEEEFGE